MLSGTCLSMTSVGFGTPAGWNESFFMYYICLTKTGRYDR